MTDDEVLASLDRVTAWLALVEDMLDRIVRRQGGYIELIQLNTMLYDLKQAKKEIASITSKTQYQ